MTARNRRSETETPRKGPHCGECIGFREVWCPVCCGFEGCDVCHYAFKVPCRTCAGGDMTLGKIQW